MLIVGIYVDDLIVTDLSEEKISDFKNRMRKMFDMSDLGELSYYLGIKVQQSKYGIAIGQVGYAKKILKLFGMDGCNESKYPMEPNLSLTKDEGGELANTTKYRRLIGSLRYLIHTRPDLAYSVGVVNRYMETPRVSHLKAGDGKLIGYNDNSHNMD